MKPLTLILSLFFVSCNHEKTSRSAAELNSADKITQLSFHLEHSLRIPNYKVDIDIYKKFDGIFLHATSKPMVGHTGWEKTLIDTTYKIDQLLFNKVLTSIRKISSRDLEFAGGSGDDGTSCEIRFGDYQNYISYVVWTPNYDAKERRTEDFLNACKQFILAANLKPDEIL